MYLHLLDRVEWFGKVIRMVGSNAPSSSLHGRKLRSAQERNQGGAVMCTREKNPKTQKKKKKKKTKKKKKKKKKNRSKKFLWKRIELSTGVSTVMTAG